MSSQTFEIDDDADQSQPHQATAHKRTTSNGTSKIQVMKCQSSSTSFSKPELEIPTGLKLKSLPPPVAQVQKASLTSIRERAKCYNCLRYGHITHECQYESTRMRTCFHCKQSDHILVDCPEADLSSDSDVEPVCAKCKQTGHLTSKCPIEDIPLPAAANRKLREIHTWSLLNYEELTWIEMMESMRIVDCLTTADITVAFEERFKWKLPKEWRAIAAWLKDNPSFKRELVGMRPM